MEINEVSKSEFLRDRKIISHYFLNLCKEVLSEEDYETLAKADDWNIKLTLNGVEMDYGTVSDIIEKVYDIHKENFLEEGFKTLLKKKIIPAELSNKLYNLQNSLDSIEKFIDNSNLGLDDGINNILYYNDMPLESREFKIIFDEDYYPTDNNKPNTGDVKIDFFTGNNGFDEADIIKLKELNCNEYAFIDERGNETLIKKGQLTEETIREFMNKRYDVCVYRTN